MVNDLDKFHLLAFAPLQIIAAFHKRFMENGLHAASPIVLHQQILLIFIWMLVIQCI